MIMYDNEIETKEYKIKTKDKIEPQHDVHCFSWQPYLDFVFSVHIDSFLFRKTYCTIF